MTLKSSGGPGRKGPAARKRERRPRYEAPKMVPLGELARGFGAQCSLGGNASGGGIGMCRDGTAANNCRDGSAVF
jgi:hypothetical protein